MAQDFGDDMGNALLNFVTRQTENYLRFGRGRERAFDWWQRHYKKEGNTPEQAKAMAEKQSSREQVVVPFGTSEEAAYYAQVCRENGTYAAVYTDKRGNGFLAFAREDAETVAGYAQQFKDVMARLDEQRITDALNHAEPVDKKTMDSLTELTSYPDLPAEDVTVIPVTIRYKDAPDETYDMLFSEQDTENLNIDDSIFFSGYSHKELTEMVGRETHEDFDVISVGAPYKVHATQVKTDAPEKTYDAPGKDAPTRSDRVATLRAEDTAIHTQNIRNAAQKAREDCTDFSDFERKMNAQGFGVTETSKGEVMAYEPASLNKDGSVGGQVLVDGCHVLRVRHSVMVDGLVGDRPVVGVRLLFALRAVLRRRVGTAFLGIIRLHGFGLGICIGLVADAIIGTAADERDESKAADGGNDLPVMRLLLAFRVRVHVVPIRR